MTIKHCLLPATFFPVLFNALLAVGQTTDGRPLMDIASRNIAEVSKGSFEMNTRFKFADRDDTITHRGMCYFFRDQPNPDSMARFVVLQDGRPAFAFDGTHFYQVLEQVKTIQVTAVESAGGARRMLRGDIRKSNLIYENLLRMGKPAFRPDAFDTVTLSMTLLDDGNAALRVTARDTTVEPALGNVENNKIIGAYHWDLYLPGLSLARHVSTVWLFDGWQYEHRTISPVVPLPASAIFSDYFDPEKLAASYTFEQYDPNVRLKRDVALVQPGDTLPDFFLPDLDGNIQKPGGKGLLLLDFWYKGCFPCQLAMPKLENLHRKYQGRGLRVWGVNPVDKDAARLKEWLAGRHLSYLTLLDTGQQLPKALGITGYPLLVIADAQTRKVLHVSMGFSEEMETQLESVISANLK